MLAQTLKKKIEDRSAVVGLVGLGYVGLPLAMEFCKAGFTVVGFDVGERVCAELMAGKSHIQDVPSAVVAQFVKSGAFIASTDPTQLRRCDAISIAVPTPLGKSRDPDLSFVLAATETIAQNAHPGLLVVLESTTYPGTTRELMKPRLEAAGFTVGTDVFLAFSPERVDPGNPVWNTKNTPKVVGGITANCTTLAESLYGSCIDTVVPVSTTEAAELVKLLENTFRAVNIGLVNEMAIVCDKLGVNVWEVIDAAATKPFGFMKFTPGPGIGGHCIPLDPHYLAWKMRALNYRTRFIQVASEVNSEMPTFVLEKVRTALNAYRKSVNGSNVLIIGVSYKRDIDDMRESPAIDIIRLLREREAVVSYHDPHVPGFTDEGVALESVMLTDEAIAAADAVVIITDHTGVDYQRLVDKARLIIDTRNILDTMRPGRAKVLALAKSASVKHPGRT